MTRIFRPLLAVGLGVLTLGVAMLPAAVAPADEVNVYTSRHYDTDDLLYDRFTRQTGIEVNIIEANTDDLLARLQREGELSPGDVFIAVDAGRLHKAVEAGVLQPVSSSAIESAIPAHLRHPDGLWFGYSLRARVIYLSHDVPEDYVTTYAQLADPKLNDGLLIRSSSNIYNQSLVASRLSHLGESQTRAWARGIVDNLARTPQGGDTDQIRALAAGEGNVAVANHYYFARLLASKKAEDREAASRVRLVFPDQGGRGTHVNVSGAGVIKGAPNRENAVKLLEFLATPEAQELWAVANFEYPVVPGVEPPAVMKPFGDFVQDPINAAELGHHNREAVRVMDRAGWR
ncbi:MAG: Fe(3+) ABC transporter substrate-binding protein [Planctomycetota bacterium]